MKGDKMNAPKRKNLSTRKTQKKKKKNAMFIHPPLASESESKTTVRPKEIKNPIPSSFVILLL